MTFVPVMLIPRKSKVREQRNFKLTLYQLKQELPYEKAHIHYNIVHSEIENLVKTKKNKEIKINKGIVYY